MAYREVSGRGALVTFLPTGVAGHLSVLANRLSIGRLELSFKRIRTRDIPILERHTLGFPHRRGSLHAGE